MREEKETARFSAWGCVVGVASRQGSRRVAGEAPVGVQACEMEAGSWRRGRAGRPGARRTAGTVGVGEIGGAN